jgi:hypothetical protein
MPIQARERGGLVAGLTTYANLSLIFGRLLTIMQKDDS